MKNLAFLEYMFMFDPTDTWQHGSQFERDLAGFFAAFGKEAEVVEVRGSSGRRVFVIKNMEKLDQMANKSRADQMKKVIRGK